MPYFERPIHCFGGDDSVHPHRPSPVLRPHTKSARAVYQWGYRGYYATAIDIYYRVNILSAGKNVAKTLSASIVLILIFWRLMHMEQMIHIFFTGLKQLPVSWTL